MTQKEFSRIFPGIHNLTGTVQARIIQWASHRERLAAFADDQLLPEINEFSINAASLHSLRDFIRKALNWTGMVHRTTAPGVTALFRGEFHPGRLAKRAKQTEVIIRHGNDQHRITGTAARWLLGVIDQGMETVTLPEIPQTMRKKSYYLAERRKVVQALFKYDRQVHPEDGEGVTVDRLWFIVGVMRDAGWKYTDRIGRGLIEYPATRRDEWFYLADAIRKDLKVSRDKNANDS